MKNLLFLLLILLLSCEKYQTHHYVCEYIRIDTFTGDTLINIPLDSMRGKDMTEDQILLWMQKERDTKFLLCGNDTIWIINTVHCLPSVCPSY